MFAIAGADEGAGAGDGAGAGAGAGAGSGAGVGSGGGAGAGAGAATGSGEGAVGFPLMGPQAPTKRLTVTTTTANEDFMPIVLQLPCRPQPWRGWRRRSWLRFSSCAEAAPATNTPAMSNAAIRVICKERSVPHEPARLYTAPLAGQPMEVQALLAEHLGQGQQGWRHDRRRRRQRSLHNRYALSRA